MSNEGARWVDKITLLPTDKLIPYAKNPRTHSRGQIERIAASIQEFGFVNPLLVNGDGEVIAGHGRLLAAQRLGMGEVPAIRLEHLTPAQVRAYRLADNQLTLLGEWDEDLLTGEIQDLEGEEFDLELLGFDGEEIERLLREGGKDEGDADGLEEVPEPPLNPVSRPGDLWLLGDHRLLCGDSTQSGDVTRLMGGEEASLLFTSPPYANQRDYTTGGISDWDGLMQGVFGNIPMREDGQCLVNLGLIHQDGEWQPYWDGWIEWMRGQGWRRFGWYVWDQGAGLPGDWSGRLAPSHEFIFHFNRQARRPNKIIPCKTAGVSRVGCRLHQADGSRRPGKTDPTQPFRIPDSVIRVGRKAGGDYEGINHPAIFPIRLAEQVFGSFSNRGEIIFEPFCGSGTGILGGEYTERKVRAVEIAPEYCDVAVRRWEGVTTGKQAVLEGDGRTFGEVAGERVGEIGIGRG